DHLPDGRSVAFLQQDFTQHTRAARDELHRRLVGLDLGEDVALGDLVAFLLQPANELSLFHGRGQRFHVDFGCHKPYESGRAPALAPGEILSRPARRLLTLTASARARARPDGTPVREHCTHAVCLYS